MATTLAPDERTTVTVPVRRRLLDRSSPPRSVTAHSTGPITGSRLAELDGDPVVRFGGQADLLELDPFVPGVGLGDVAGTEDDAGQSGRAERPGVGAEGDAQDLGPAAGGRGDGLAQRVEPAA